jgi:hypothetical protein
MDMSAERKFSKEQEAKENLKKIQEKQDRESAALLLMTMRAELTERFSKTKFTT